MQKTQHIYVLKVDDEIFYIGRTTRELTKRLEEHIFKALNPTKKDLVKDALLGFENPKRKVIRIATEEKWDITIESVYECPLTEELDEESWIQHYRRLGYCLTNTAKGNVWRDRSLIKPKKKKKKIELFEDEYQNYINKIYQGHLRVVEYFKGKLPEKSKEDLYEQYKDLIITY